MSKTTWWLGFSALTACASLQHMEVHLRTSRWARLAWSGRPGSGDRSADSQLEGQGIAHLSVLHNHHNSFLTVEVESGAHKLMMQSVARQLPHVCHILTPRSRTSKNKENHNPRRAPGERRAPRCPKAVVASDISSEACARVGPARDKRTIRSQQHSGVLPRPAAPELCSPELGKGKLAKLGGAALA